MKSTCPDEKDMLTKQMVARQYAVLLDRNADEDELWNNIEQAYRLFNDLDRIDNHLRLLTLDDFRDRYIYPAVIGTLKDRLAIAKAVERRMKDKMLAFMEQEFSR